MADRDVLLALANRCEREEPSAELNKAIYVASGFCLHEKTTFSGAQSDTGFTCDDCRADSWGNRSKNGKNQRLYDNVIAYTTSLDAAVTLVPDDCVWGVDNFAGTTARIIGGDVTDGWDVYSDVGTTKTPALALCAAALRARAALAPAPTPRDEA